MNVRPYRDEDWTVVCEVYDLSKPDELAGVVAPEAICPLESDASMKKLFGESTIWVAELESRPVAFAGNRGSMITWLFVHPGFRRTGVASSLLRQVLASLDRPVVLNVASSNTRARALYEQFNFRVEREFMGNFQGMPCSVARLSLT
jgi:ribosomal protein S18 acetylase RimI-like enzyme